MSYKFVKDTFGKSTDRRRFLMLNIVVHLVSSALQLVSLVTQPLYLATRTDPGIFDFWICTQIKQPSDREELTPRRRGVALRR